MADGSRLSLSAATTKPFELTPKQREGYRLMGGAQSHTLLYGGSRSGKTFLICYANGMRAIKAPGSRHAITRLHNIDVRQAVMMDTFPKVMRLAWPDVPVKINKVDQFATIETAQGTSEIWFAGLDDKDRVDKILGKEFATITVNEASQVSYSSVETLRTRLAQSVATVSGAPLKLRAFYDLNPSGRAHWTYKEFHEGLKPTGERVSDLSDFSYLVMNPLDNPHLPAAYIKQLEGLSARQRKRFLEGQYLADVPGALWTSDQLTELRRPLFDPRDATRIVVAVDPATTANPESDETGIIAVAVQGTGRGAHGYVLRDASGRYSPRGWATKAVALYREFNADRIVAEGNQGGDMVREALKSVDANAPVKIVHASRGKQARAEPVAALYEEGRMHHVGPLQGLEDQMTSWVPGEGDSPDRVDALVWAVNELMLTGTDARTVNIRIAG